MVLGSIALPGCRPSVVGCPGAGLPGLGARALEPLAQDFILVTHLAPLLGISLLLGQDPPSQVPHPRIRVLEEPVELRPAPARDVEAVVQEALDVALALPVLALLRGQVRAIATEVAGMVAAGEALVRPPAPAAPAEMTALLTGLAGLLGLLALAQRRATQPACPTRGVGRDSRRFSSTATTSSSAASSSITSRGALTMSPCSRKDGLK